MTIVWKGFGILVPISLLAIAAGLDALFPLMNKKLFLLLVFLPNGLLWYYLGKHLNKTKIIYEGDYTRIDDSTKHSLFWIPVEYFGMILLAGAALNLLGLLISFVQWVF